jgi:hypothetical protein
MATEHTHKSLLPGSPNYHTTVKSGGTTYHGSGGTPEDSRQAAKIKADQAAKNQG